MASSYRRALDMAIAAMMREAIEHSVALEHVLDQINQLVSLRIQLGNSEIVENDAHRGVSHEVVMAAEPPVAQTVLSRLTKREREVLEHLVRGSSNRQIARLLGISERTVKNHLHGIFTKLEVADRTSAAVKALTMDLTQTGN